MLPGRSQVESCHPDSLSNCLPLNWEGICWFLLGEGKELHLISFLKEPAIINKAVHLALSTSNFDAFVKSLEAKKIPYSDWPGIPNKINIRADGIKQIFFQDPNDYWIEVNSIGNK